VVEKRKKERLVEEKEIKKKTRKDMDHHTDHEIYGNGQPAGQNIRTLMSPS